MSFQLQMEHMPGYLAARFTGAGVTEDLWQQYELIVEHCERTKNTKLLIDTTGFDLIITTLDRFFLGDRSRIFSRHGLKVVFVARPEQIDPEKLGETVARNRGVSVRVFPDFNAAEEWLLK
jgi:hypothetical protein